MQSHWNNNCRTHGCVALISEINQIYMRAGYFLTIERKKHSSLRWHSHKLFLVSPSVSFVSIYLRALDTGTLSYAWLCADINIEGRTRHHIRITAIALEHPSSASLEDVGPLPCRWAMKSSDCAKMVLVSCGRITSSIQSLEAAWNTELSCSIWREISAESLLA